MDKAQNIPGVVVGKDNALEEEAGEDRDDDLAVAVAPSSAPLPRNLVLVVHQTPLKEVGQRAVAEFDR